MLASLHAGRPAVGARCGRSGGGPARETWPASGTMGRRRGSRAADPGESEKQMTPRREFLVSSATAAVFPMLSNAATGPFRYSICNEVFEKRDFRESCKLARSMGYAGLEIAPFTLGETVREIAPVGRKELREIMHGEGLILVGLQWLLVTPNWLHITTGDAAVRKRSWDYSRELIDFCGALLEGQSEPAVMVLGSPKQRGTKGATVEQAKSYLAE